MALEQYILRIIKDTGLSKNEIWEMTNARKKLETIRPMPMSLEPMSLAILGMNRIDAYRP